MSRLHHELKELSVGAYFWKDNLAPVQALSKCLELEEANSMRLLQDAHERL